MDFEGILRVSDQFSSEFQFINEEFVGHWNEQDNDSEVSDDPHSSATVDLDKTTEDNAEEAIITELFNEEPCCSLQPSKAACLLDWGWPWEVSLLRALHSLPGTTCESSRSSIRYLFEVVI